jgi:hypothetical protein
MTWTLKIEADNDNLDSVLLKVYSDIKKKKYITKQPFPRVLTELDCECKDKVKYCVSEVCR